MSFTHPLQTTRPKWTAAQPVCAWWRSIMAVTSGWKPYVNMQKLTVQGVSMLGISDASEKIGFRSLGVKLSSVQLKEAELPAILHWRQGHFVVLYKVKGRQFYLADPPAGLIKLSEADL